MQQSSQASKPGQETTSTAAVGAPKPQAAQQVQPQQRQAEPQQQLGSFTGGGGFSSLFDWALGPGLWGGDVFSGIDTALAPWGGGGISGSSRLAALPQFEVDLASDQAGYYLKGNVPGVTKDAIKLEIDDRTNTLHINVNPPQEERNETYEEGGYRVHRRERASSSMYRAFKLPPDADFNAITANVANGVLKVDVKKKEGGAGAAPGRRAIAIE